MSVDGPGLFADDTSHDVRTLYRGFIADGKSSAEATDLLMKEWDDLLDDPDHSLPFWLGLAATQWKLGRLEPRVRKKALEIIRNGSDLVRWKHNPSDQRKRKAVLERLRKQLVSPPPSAKPVMPTTVVECTWEVGEILAYKLNSGKYVLFRVSGIACGNPVLELLDWIGDVMLSTGEILALPKRQAKMIWITEELDWGTSKRQIRNESRFQVSALKPKSPYQRRITRLGIKQDGTERTLPCVGFYWWSKLEDDLANWFDFPLQ
jgi:hypothetical protein